MRFRPMFSCAVLALLWMGSIGAAGAETAAAPTTTLIETVGSDARISIKSNGTHVDIVTGTSQLAGDRRGDKRYYHLGTGGAALVEVKSGADGFKLRSPSGKLLWKVKIDDDKVKVSDNEANANAWTVRRGDADKAKVADPNGAEVGAARYDAASGKTRVVDAAGKPRYLVATVAPSPAYGVLLMEGVPQPYRSVIVAELLAR